MQRKSAGANSQWTTLGKTAGADAALKYAGPVQSAFHGALLIICIVILSEARDLCTRVIDHAGLSHREE